MRLKILLKIAEQIPALVEKYNVTSITDPWIHNQNKNDSDNPNSHNEVTMHVGSIGLNRHDKGDRYHFTFSIITSELLRVERVTLGTYKKEAFTSRLRAPTDDGCFVRNILYRKD